MYSAAEVVLEIDARFPGIFIDGKVCRLGEGQSNATEPGAAGTVNDEALVSAASRSLRLGHHKAAFPFGWFQAQSPKASLVHSNTSSRTGSGRCPWGETTLAPLLGTVKINTGPAPSGSAERNDEIT